MDLIQLQLNKITHARFVVLAFVIVVAWPGHTAGRPLIKALCNPDNGTIDPDTVFTRAAARKHTDNLGVTVPGSRFKGSLSRAAVIIQYGSEQRQWVMLTMADKKVALTVLPLTLKALGRLPLDQGLEPVGASLLATDAAAAAGGGDDGGGAVASTSGAAGAAAASGSGRMLSSLLVVMTWDNEAQAACVELQEEGYGHECVQDQLHELHQVGSTNMSAFHSPEFNALGFAKIKYLYDALSLGYDVMTMDADVVVLQSPFPAVLQQRAQLAALTERCEIVDPSMQLQLGLARHPSQNIGVLVARSEGPVLRCVERWFGSMVAHVDFPLLWDQEEYNKVISHCAHHLGLRWHSLDNRRFVSMCYPRCGCTYPDEERKLLTDPAMRRKHFEWSFRRGAPYEDPAQKTCGPSAWADWILAHFPCQGSIQDKVLNMGKLMEGYELGEPRVIKNIEKVP